MSVKSVQQAFEEFELDVVRVPSGEIEAAKAVHPEIRRVLEKELPGTVKTFLVGSYARKTQVAPRLKDVDVICVLEDPDGEFLASASSTQETVREAAKRSDLVRNTLLRKRAVKLFLEDHEFTVDVVPALEPSSGEGLLIPLCIPDEGCDRWALANPKGQVAAAARRNEACGQMYVPAVRLVKFWNGTHGKPLRSYQAEAILWHAMATVEGASDFADAMLSYFDYAYDVLAPGRLVSDPGNPGAYVDDRMSAEDREAARDKVAGARDHARRAVEADDLEEQLKEWAKVFGSAFPTTVETEEALAKALREGSVAAVGTGIAVGTGRVLLPTRSWRAR